jgi:hypothetical protein
MFQKKEYNTRVGWTFNDRKNFVVTREVIFFFLGFPDFCRTGLYSGYVLSFPKHQIAFSNLIRSIGMKISEGLNYFIKK